MKIADIHIKIFGPLKLSFHFLEKINYYIIDFISNNFLQQWQFPLSVVIQLKAAKQYFPVVLFIVLYKLVRTFSLWMKS